MGVQGCCGCVEGCFEVSMCYLVFVSFTFFSELFGLAVL